MRGEGATIDEIHARLAEHGVRISRSAVARYVRSATPAVERFHVAREMAAEWLTAIQRQPDSDAGLLAGELMKLLAWHRAGALETAAADGAEIDARDIRHLAGSLKDLAAADATAAARIKAARKEAREAAAEAAVAAAREAGERQGVAFTPEDLLRIRRDVYGLEDQAA